MTEQAPDAAERRAEGIDRDELVLMVAWQAAAISGGKMRDMTGVDILTQRERLEEVLTEALGRVDDFNRRKSAAIPRLDVAAEVAETMAEVTGDAAGPEAE